MDQKIGRNDPCSCGSGKKYKQCCSLKDHKPPATKRKLTAKWINAPQGPNLMDRTFGNAIHAAGTAYQPLAPEPTQSPLEEKEEQK